MPSKADRREYYKAFYRANRDRRLAQVREYQVRNYDYIRAMRKNTLRKAQWLLVAKVAREWEVSRDEARAMIERGSFPP